MHFKRTLGLIEMMKLYLAYIPLFLITYQNIDREKEIPGKYIGYFFGEHELYLKNNGKFVKSGFDQLPQDELDPPPGNMPSRASYGKKSKYKTKGSWVYFKKDNLDGVLLKTTNHVDSLYFLENGNLSTIKPIRNVIPKANDTSVIVINRGNVINSSIVIGVEFVKK